MSININHPQDDISTDGGNPPTLGSQSPLVADNATVSANSSGNVSRWVMSTAGSTANYWTKISTITNNTGITQGKSIRLLAKSFNAYDTAGASFVLFDADIRDDSTVGLDATRSSVRILSASGFNSSSIMMVGSASVGGAIDIWIQAPITGRLYFITEIDSNEISDFSTAYNNASTWTSSTPSGAVTITSDWAGAGTFLPYTEGDSTAGTGTYSQRLASHQIKNGRCVGWLRVDQSAHTGTGNIIVKGLPAPHAGPSGLHSTCVVHSNTFVIGAGKQLSGLVYQGTSEIRLYAIDVAGGATAQIAMDATASFIIYFDYAV